MKVYIFFYWCLVVQTTHRKDRVEVDQYQRRKEEWGEGGRTCPIPSSCFIISSQVTALLQDGTHPKEYPARIGGGMDRRLLQMENVYKPLKINWKWE